VYSVGLEVLDVDADDNSIHTIRLRVWVNL